MGTSKALVGVKQIAIGLIVCAIVAVSIALPLMATDYPVRQGPVEAQILSSAAGMGMAAKPVLRARVEDETGRVFWVQLPSTHSFAAGTALILDVWCETEAFESCAARYLSTPP